MLTSAALPSKAMEAISFGGGPASTSHQGFLTQVLNVCRENNCLQSKSSFEDEMRQQMLQRLVCMGYSWIILLPDMWPQPMTDCLDPREVGITLHHG